MAKLEVEALLAAAGIDVKAAKAGLVELDNLFEGEAGDIPDGALNGWINQYFDNTRKTAFFHALGKAWEVEHAASLGEHRKWERGPDAAAEKARRNVAKAAAKAGK